MAKIKILQDFKFAHRGVEVVEYAKDTEIETEDDELIEISVGNGWAALADGNKQKPKKGGAPENKDASQQADENKDAES